MVELWGIMGNYGELWGIMGQLWLIYGELWGIMGFYGELVILFFILYSSKIEVFENYFFDIVLT